MSSPQTMRDYCAVYAVDRETEQTFTWQEVTEPFVRFFKADDLDHAYEQALDGCEQGERLVCVADGPVRTFVAADSQEERMEASASSPLTCWLDDATDAEKWAGYGMWVDDRLGTNPGEPIATFTEWQDIERAFAAMDGRDEA